MNLKYIWLIAKKEYCRWLFSYRMIMLVFVLLPMREMIVIPMRRAAEVMNSPLNICEPFVATVNSTVGIILIIIVYIMLSSVFPTIGGNEMYYISRMGRRNWICGEVLFQVLASFTYCMIIFGICSVQVSDISFIADGWSPVITDYDDIYSEEYGNKMGGILPPSLFFQMRPYRAVLLSFILIALFLIICGMLVLAGSMFGRKLVFYIIQVAQIAAGCSVMLLGNKAMWIFPVCHASLSSHYNSYFRKYNFNPDISVIVLAVIVIITVAFIIRNAIKINVDMLRYN